VFFLDLLSHRRGIGFLRTGGNATISAKHGEADAKKSNPRSRSTLTFDRKKKVRNRGMLRENITVHRFRVYQSLKVQKFESLIISPCNFTSIRITSGLLSFACPLTPRDNKEVTRICRFRHIEWLISRRCPFFFKENGGSFAKSLKSANKP